MKSLIRRWLAWCIAAHIVAMGWADACAQSVTPAPTPGDLLSLPSEPAAAQSSPPAEDGLLSLPSLPPAAASSPTPSAVPGQPPVEPVAAGAPQPPPVTSPAPQAAPITAPAPEPAPLTEEQKAAQTLHALLPNPLDIVSDTDANGFKPSYGNWPYSIMYSSVEMTNLKNILALYERKGFVVEQASPTQKAEEAPPPSVDDILQKIKDQPLPANIAYPSFKLRSILYRGANNWSVWLNNRHITNENNSGTNEIAVVSVNRDYAEFAWVPTNPELLSAILQVRLLPEASRPPVKETPKHRKAINKSATGWLDKASSAVHFILRPNQIFYAETFEVFEGTPPALSASVNQGIQMESPAAATAPAMQEDPTKIIKDLQKQLEDAQKAQGGASGPAPASTPAANDAAATILNQKQNPKAQMMRTLGLGQ